MCSPFRAQLAGTAAAPVLLIVFAPFVRGLLGGPLLLFCSWCTCPFRAQLARMGIAPVFSWHLPPFVVRLARMAITLVSLMVCFPLSCMACRDSHCFSFTHCVPSLCCEARWEGYCSGFTHGAFAPLLCMAHWDGCCFSFTNVVHPLL